MAPQARDWARIVAYAALPTIGLVGGPSYADIVFAIGAVCFLHAWLLGRGIPRMDWRFPALAVAFAVLCAASVLWSVVPSVSARGAVQMTAIFAGTLAFLAIPPGPALSARHEGVLFATILGATTIGAVTFWTDHATGFHLQAALTHRPDLLAPTKYNRGIDYLVILSWPVLGYFCWRRAWARAALMLVLAGGVAALGASLAGKVAAIAGLATLALALWVPRLIERALLFAVPLAAAIWPFVLRVVAEERGALMPYLKRSALNRVEIWDYMSWHVLRHPLLGSGLLSARFLPVPPSELRHFLIVKGPGIYPHDQWLQLWVETGALGVVLGAVFAVLVVRGARALPPRLRPFAYAGIVACLVVSAVNFEVTTDSWWAAIAAAAFLFVVPARSVAAGAGRSTTSAPAELVVNRPD